MFSKSWTYLKQPSTSACLASFRPIRLPQKLRPDLLGRQKIANSASRRIPLCLPKPKPKHTSRGPEYITLQSSSWTLIVGGAAVGGTLAVGAYIYSTWVTRATEASTESTSGVKNTLGYLDMPSKPSPGHVGNLTEEQEAKLREFWAATLKVFGVESPQAAATGDEDAATKDAADALDETASTTTEKEKKKSKRRLGIFKRHDKETPSTPSSDATTNSPATPSAEDDKYGQTKEFHQTLAEQTPEELRTAFWSMVKSDHPDALLLRFLRARKWDVEKALVMLIATMRWRSKDVHVDDDIVANGEGGALENSKSSDKAVAKEAEDFLVQMRMGKSFLHGVDKEGRPLTFVRVRLHKQGEQSEAALERFTVYTIETARLMLVPPVETACIIFDMTGFSLANMDYSPVKFMIKCFEANYPESLGAVLIHKAPWIFQGIWTIIKGWLDPVVAAKVHFTRSVEDLEQYIDKSRIIKELGGEEDWEYKYVEPTLPEEQPPVKSLTEESKTIRDKLLLERTSTVLEYQKKTFEWIASPSSGATIKGERDVLAKSLKENYWGIDKYLRARSYYDRIGVIGEKGQVTFYPEKIEKTEKVEKVEKPAEVEPSADDVD